MNKINKRFLSDTFLKHIDNESIKCELSKFIYESMNFRINNKISQKEYSKIKNHEKRNIS